MKTFTNCIIKYVCLAILIGYAVIPLKSSAQKKGTAFLNNPVVYINLMLPSGDSLLLVDGAGVLYANKFSANVDADDAGKLSNRNENICLLRDGQKLAVETRPIPAQTDTLFIHMWGIYSKTYTLQVAIKAVPLMLPVKAWLIDNYLNTRTQIDLFNKTLYSFSAGSDTNSYLNRFKIVFIRNHDQEDSIISSNKGMQLSTGSVTIYPNPLTGNKLILQFNNVPEDYYTVKLTNLSGEVLSLQNIMHIGGSNKYYLPINAVYIKGIYTITISGRKTEKILHLPVVIN